MTERELHVEKFNLFVADCLEAIQLSNPPVVQVQCGGCGLPMRFPLIARHQDIQDFRRVIEAAERVLARHGIQALLMSEILAECHIQIAKNKGANHDN